MADPIAKLPPQNIEAEQSVLGALMLDKDAITKVADFLTPVDFYRHTHQTIYQAMLDIYQKNEPIDHINLVNRLKALGQLDAVGGSVYITNLVNAVPAATHVAHYARIVREKRTMRDLIDASSHILGLGYQEDRDVEQLVDEAEARIFGIAQRSMRQEFIPIESLLQETFQRIDRLHEGGGALRGVPTGFADLDNQLSGLQKSDLIVLAARPGVGKTTLALDIARHAAQAGLPVGIFSLEMSKDQLVDRFLAAEAGVDLWRLRTGKLAMSGPNNDFTRLQEAFGNIAKLPLYLDDAGTATIMEMRTLARRLKAERGLSLIVVDYLQLMRTTRRTENRVQEISEISRSLKALARELDVPVLALSQLSRGVEHRPDHRPKLADLRDSGSIEQDADVVMFIYREDMYEERSERKNVAEILIEKHRNGPTGRIELFFNASNVRFENLERLREETTAAAEVPGADNTAALEEDIFA